MSRPRRKSSGLGAEPRGDTGAPALSTLEPTPIFNSPPLTPVCTHVIMKIPMSRLTLSSSGALKPKSPALFPNDGKPSLSCGDGKHSPFDTHGSTLSSSSSSSSPPMPSIQPLQILFTTPSFSPTLSRPTTLTSPTTLDMTVIQCITAKAPKTLLLWPSTLLFSLSPVNSSCSDLSVRWPCVTASAHAQSRIASWNKSTLPCISPFWGRWVSM